MSRALLALPLALAACTVPDYDPMGAPYASLPYVETGLGDVGWAPRERPFEAGPVIVLAHAPGRPQDLGSWTLTPCGAEVCAASQRSRIAPVGEWRVVTLHGRTFWLASGGTAWVDGPTGREPAAWDVAGRAEGAPR